MSPSVDSTGRRGLCQSCQALGPWATNAYVLVCPVTSESVLIDPAGEPEMLLSMLVDSQPVAILITHAHPDHIGALDAMRAALQAPVMAHPGSALLKADRWLEDGDLVQVGDHALAVHHTPGHTNDSVCYPGHGESFRLGDKRPAIEVFLAKDHGDFFGDATWEM